MITLKLFGRVMERTSPMAPKSDVPERPATRKEKIIAGESIDIVKFRPGELTEVSIVFSDGKRQAFYIANPDKERPGGFADEIEFWDAAFIENAHGATTETVRF